MSHILSTSVVMALFMALTSFVFLFFINSWTDHSIETALALNRQLERVESAISIDSTSENGVTCTSYTAQVDNTGEVTIADSSKMDLLVQYINSSNNKIAARLSHNTTWSVASIVPDSRDANSWNSAEVATIDFTLPSAVKNSTRGTVLMSTPLGVSDSTYFTCFCTAGNTGFSDPSAEIADTGGDDDGYELDPINALSNGVVYASNIGGDGDRHRFYDYGFSIHKACNISGIEVRLDWWMDSSGGGNSMDAELSWDGGSTWTAAKTDSEETTTEHTVILGGSSDTWGRTWSMWDFTDSNFRVRASMNGVDGHDYFLDWIPVQVHYAPP